MASVGRAKPGETAGGYVVSIPGPECGNGECQRQ